MLSASSVSLSAHRHKSLDDSGCGGTLRMGLAGLLLTATKGPTMASSIRHVAVDCADAYRLGQFWAAVLDASLADDDEPGDAETSVRTPDVTLLFISVPEPKATKNRVHLDLQPRDRTRDEEIERVASLGATVVADFRRADGTGWVTLADIEGNEFCVERSAAERAG